MRKLQLDKDAVLIRGIAGKMTRLTGVGAVIATLTVEQGGVMIHRHAAETSAAPYFSKPMGTGRPLRSST
jgi:hypothetical protein